MKKCNQIIRDAREVSVHNYNVGDPALDQAHTRGLPADHVGPVRVVSISGDVDTNLCCGTHVSNTSQLQMIQLVGAESKVEYYSRCILNIAILYRRTNTTSTSSLVEESPHTCTPV